MLNAFNSLAPLLDTALEKLRTRRVNIPIEEERLAACRAMIHHQANRFSEAFKIPADDLVQEGMIAVIICSRTCKPGMGHFRAFAKPRICGRMIEFCVANVGPVTRDSRSLRETNFKFLPFDEPVHEDGPTLAEFLPAAETDVEQPPARFLNKEVCDAIAGALETLPPKHKAVVILKVWGGFTNADAGEILGMSPKSVLEVFGRALKHMRDSSSLLAAAPLQQFDRGQRAGKMWATHKYDAAFKKRTIKEWFASGLPAHEYAGRIGLCTGTLVAWKRKFVAANPDQRPPNAHTRYTAEFKDTLIQRMLDGESVIQLSIETGINRGILFNWKRHHLATSTNPNPQTSLCN